MLLFVRCLPQQRQHEALIIGNTHRARILICVGSFYQDLSRLSRKIVAESGSPLILIGWNSMVDGGGSTCFSFGSVIQPRLCVLRFLFHRALLANDYRLMTNGPNLNGPATKKQ